ncbi:UDP-glucose 4-epimerase [Candidatus Gottesmanbacteria bacterium RBG_16_52_11]|uniref:UDP-glucose 4-epimerase n=1 Tax=Candidatus Gottesmanbacteria bacterium RBG_16_52_11 TaxID=1798374 RepID=A0A1F5YVZ9_9BACT|nr:MAG: UDP-glucose 4-epimerase [Candidatus Gottesmanbacteria bacterium RBG_16_52_11]
MTDSGKKVSREGSIKTVLVTGGGGYVGAVLVPKLLAAGYRVRVLDWFIYGEDVFGKYGKDPKLTILRGDLRDRKSVEKALKGADAVIHLACISNDPSFELDPALGRTVNYDATALLTDLSCDEGVTRFVFASSSSVYGVKTESDVTEDLPLKPLTDYSKYKALSEEYILKKGSRDFTVLILRPATVCGYSPRMRLDLTVNILTINALINNRITVFGGSQLRPNIHIGDMTDLYVKTMEFPGEKIAGKIYNAGYENMKVLDIARMVKKVLGKRDIEISVKPTDDLRSYHINSDKIRRELGFAPRHTIREAISDIKSAYESGKLPDPTTDIRYVNIKTMKALSGKLAGKSGYA